MSSFCRTRHCTVTVVCTLVQSGGDSQVSHLIPWSNPLKVPTTFFEKIIKQTDVNIKLQKYQNPAHWRGETICVLCTVVRMVYMRCKHFSWPLVVTQETVVPRYHMFARDSEIVKLDNYCYRLLIHCVNKRQFLQVCDHHLALQDWFLWIHESGKWRILIVKCQRFYLNELDWTRCDEEVFMTWFCFYLWN